MNEVTISNGHYNVTVEGHTLAKSQNGTPSVKIQFMVHECIENPEEQVNKKMYLDLYLSDKARSFSLDTLYKVLDWEGSSLAELNEDNSLVGKECIANIVNEKYDGKVTAKIHYISKTLGMTSLDSDELGEFESFDDEVKAYRKQKGYGSSDSMPI